MDAAQGLQILHVVALIAWCVVVLTPRVFSDPDDDSTQADREAEFLARHQREQQYLAQVESDWRESFTGTIDEFIERDAAA